MDSMGRRRGLGAYPMSVERMRRDFLRRLAVNVRALKAIACSWVFRLVLLISSGFLYAVDLEGLSLPMAEALRTAQDKVERDVNILASPEARSDARGDLAMLYHAQFLLDVAEVEYTKAVEEVSLPRWHYLRGIVRMDRGGVREAIEDFTLVIQQEPNNHLALYRLGVALALTGDHSRARAVLLRAELHAPESPAVLSALADTAIAAKNWDLAKEYLEQSWRIEESGQVAYKLGLVWTRLGDLKASIEWIAKRNPTAPTIRDPLLLEVAELSVSPQFFVKAAKWAWERGDVDEALQAYRVAAKLAPADTVIGLGFARVLESQGRSAEAINELRRVVQENPGEGTAWRQLASLLHPADVQAAIEAAEMAMTVDNSDASHALFGALAMKARSYATASSVYEKLTARDAKNPYYFYWLAMARLAEQNCAGGLESLSEVIRLRSSWGEAHVVQIRAHALCGAAPERVKARRKALALLQQRSDPDMRLTLAFTEMSVGNLDNARILIEAELPHHDATMLGDALKRNMLPPVPFAADSRWWEPEEIRGPLPQIARQREG